VYNNLQRCIKKTHYLCGIRLRPCDRLLDTRNFSLLQLRHANICALSFTRVSHSPVPYKQAVNQFQASAAKCSDSSQFLKLTKSVTMIIRKKTTKAQLSQRKRATAVHV